MVGFTDSGSTGQSSRRRQICSELDYTPWARRAPSDVMLQTDGCGSPRCLKYNTRRCIA
jgi:hypothetical protein